MALPIAVQIYSVRDEAKADLRGTLEKIKKMGYDGVELAGLYGNSPAEIAGMCKEVGLTPISAHVPYADMLADPKGVLSAYAEIGCRYVAIPSMRRAHRVGTENWPTVAENIKMLGQTAKELDMQLLYHNHDYEFVKSDGKYALDLLYEAVSADLLGTELDVGWVNIGGEVPAEYIRKYAGRCPVVHLKDFYYIKDENASEPASTAPKSLRNFEDCPLGCGIQDFPAILKAAEESGTGWVVVELDDPSMGLAPMECIEKSIQYLKTLGY